MTEEESEYLDLGGNAGECKCISSHFSKMLMKELLHQVAFVMHKFCQASITPMQIHYTQFISMNLANMSFYTCVPYLMQSVKDDVHILGSFCPELNRIYALSPCFIINNYQ